MPEARNIIEPLHFQRQVKMGLGEAILRLVHVELKYANGVFDLPEHLKQEREMIVEALNQYELDLGFDCNTDGVPDTVEIFEQAALTSCCRIFTKDTSRTRAAPKITIPTLERPVLAAKEGAGPAPEVVAPPPSPEPPTPLRRKDLSRRR